MIRPAVTSTPERARADRARDALGARRCARRERAHARAHPLQRPAPGSSSSCAVGGERLSFVLDDDDLAAGLEPLVDALVRVGDDRGSRRGELERPARRRERNGRVGATRHVEVDPRRRDRPREDVERHVADLTRIVRCRHESPVRRERSRSRGLLGSARPPSPMSTPGGTCRRSRRRRRPSPSRPAAARRTPGRHPRRPPRPDARRARAAAAGLPREFESTRSYSDGSAPW